MFLHVTKPTPRAGSMKSAEASYEKYPSTGTKPVSEIPRNCRSNIKITRTLLWQLRLPPLTSTKAVYTS